MTQQSVRGVTSLAGTGSPVPRPRAATDQLRDAGQVKGRGAHFLTHRELQETLCERPDACSHFTMPLVPDSQVLKCPNPRKQLAHLEGGLLS